MFHVVFLSRGNRSWQSFETEHDAVLGLRRALAVKASDLSALRGWMPIGLIWEEPDYPGQHRPTCYCVVDSAVVHNIAIVYHEATNVVNS